MHKYFATIRPVDYANVPANYIWEETKSFFPPLHDKKMLGTIEFLYYYGTAAYSYPLSFERLDRFTMYPEDEVEFCAYMLWRYGDKDADTAEYVLRDYLTNATQRQLDWMGDIGDVIKWIKLNEKESEVCKLLQSL